MIAPDLKRELSELLGESIRFDVPARTLTSLRVGGPVDAVAEPEDRAQLSALLELCRRYGLRHHVIGRGFNTIVGEAGIDGVVIQLSKWRRLERRADDAVYVEAGVSHATLTAFCREHGLSGLEFGAGIPGSLGGWVAMNAGIPSREIQHAVREIEVMGPGGEGARTIPRDALDFAYRSLRGLAPGSIVLSALLEVTEALPADVKARIDEHMAKRSGTQPLDRPSCGSVFKNPEGDFAGRLVEAAGLKGERAGGARISSLHANFIVNEGDASASDVLELIERARRTVLERTGQRLEPEVRIWERKS